MQIGRVVLHIEQLKQDFPFSTEHLVEVLSKNKANSYCEVTEEDNEVVEQSDNKTRVRIHYEDIRDCKMSSFTLLVPNNYFDYI